MGLPHLDCTTEAKRIDICNDYNVNADDCIVLYGGDTVRSDANNRVIEDRYYQFSCSLKTDENVKYVITCGETAARHLCKLIKQEMPHAFNPFEEETVITKASAGTASVATTNDWNPIRRSLYYAVQFFIIRYQHTIQPGTKIFTLLHSLTDKKYIHLEPRKFQYEGVMSVVSKYKTSIPQIMTELKTHGKIRDFDFENLATAADKYVTSSCPNIFR